MSIVMASHGPPDIITQMSSLFNARLRWLCKQCRDKPFAIKPSIIEYISLHTQTAIPTLHPKPTLTEYASLHTQTSTPTLTPTLNPPNSLLNNLLTGRTPTIYIYITFYPPLRRVMIPPISLSHLPQ